jgi:hypothetical protein
MNDPSLQTEGLGEAGEPCRSCGAPLAADQRYCLNCGQRRGGPRLDFRQHLPTDSQAASAKAPPVEPQVTSPAASDAKPAQRDYTPLAAVGGIAVLGLMLLIGVLIGKGNNPTATTPPPQVVHVDGGTGGSAQTASKDSGQSKGSGKGASKASAKGGDKLLGAQGGSGPVEASDEALKELESQSPDEYSESSAKLPDEISTGGAPPPEDSKAPGGGSKGTAIE